MESVKFLDLNSFYQHIYDLLTGRYLPNSDPIVDKIFYFIVLIKPYSLVLSLLFLTGIIYCSIRTSAIMHDYLEKMHGHGHGHDGHGEHDGHGAHDSHGESHGHGESAGAHAESGGHGHSDSHHEEEGHSNPRWEKITEHIHSTNPSDWRLAILECDIVLDEMLTKMSYHGETVADKLKAVERSDFLTIDQAWEAHKVRNAVAHEGSNFMMTEREAKRVVGLYEQVFKEFHYI
jgi:hypothetical protein